jgi:hypothetical protein
LEDLEDASNELMLSDEENIRYVVGGCFVTLEKDEAETTLQVTMGWVTRYQQVHITIVAQPPVTGSTAGSATHRQRYQRAGSDRSVTSQPDISTP